MSGDGFAVYGGAEGSRASLEDLDAIASALDRVCDLLSQCGQKLIQVQLDLWNQPVYLNGTGIPRSGPAATHFRRVDDGLLDCRVLVGTDGAYQTSIGELAASVRATRSIYEGAENNVYRSASTDAAQFWTHLVSGVMTPWVLRFNPLLQMGRSVTDDFVASALSGDPTSLAELLRSHHPQIRRLLAPLAEKFGLGTPSATALTGGLLALTSPSKPRQITTVTRRQVLSTAGTTSLAGLVTQIESMYPRASGLGDPAVRIDRVTADDGTRSWIVAIPGTQVAGFGVGPNPFDMDQNIRAFGGLEGDVTDAVERALRDAGALKGEPVLLTGHSQGGLVAATLAASPAFTAQFTVGAVLTVGSPIAHIAVPDSTPVLALENLQDAIPALAGAANPDGRNHVTVVRDLAATDDPALHSGIFGPHTTTAYGRTAALVDASTDPSILAWKQAAAPMLAGGAAVIATTYTIHRYPVDQPEATEAVVHPEDNLGPSLTTPTPGIWVGGPPGPTPYIRPPAFTALDPAPTEN